MDSGYERGFAEWLAELVGHQAGYEVGVDATRNRLTVRNAIGETFLVDIRHAADAGPHRRRTELREAERRLVAYATAGHELHADDWFPLAPDGGDPIRALRTKISQLELELLYGFNRRGRPNGTCGYVLVHTPDSPLVEPLATGAVQPAPPAATDDGTLDLFDEAYEQDQTRPGPGFFYVDEDDE
jgi:hypothetical protein